ncbi:hypothetical protein NKH18_16430 [Streptomyces sp. M10(2022)]
MVRAVPVSAAGSARSTGRSSGREPKRREPKRRAGSAGWRVARRAAPAFVSEEPNDSSVTLFVRSGELTLLLLGDLEPPSQQGLLRRYPRCPGWT